MIEKHPSEAELQEFALNQANTEKEAVEHIAKCEQCKVAIASYRALFTGIQQQTLPAFDFNLSALVLAQLPKAKRSSMKEKFLSYLGVVVALTLVGISAYIFWDYATAVFEGIAPILIYLIITAVAIIITGSSLDLYKTYQKKMSSLDIY